MGDVRLSNLQFVNAEADLFARPEDSREDLVPVIE